MTNKLRNKDCTDWLETIKERLKSSRIKAALAANSVLIEFYFYLGKSISEKEIV